MIIKLQACDCEADDGWKLEVGGWRLDVGGITSDQVGDGCMWCSLIGWAHPPTVDLSSSVLLAPSPWCTSVAERHGTF